jgi:hypothetical protein
VTETGKGRRTGGIDKGVGVVGVEAEVGQTLVGAGMGMTGGSPRMIDTTAIGMNQIIGLGRVVTVRGETVVVVAANHMHIDISRKVAHQLVERARNSAKGRGQRDTHLALVLRPHLSGKRAIGGTREGGTPVPGRVH